MLAEDVISPVDVPAHDNSAMDGWAVRFADLDARRRDAPRTRSAIASPASRSSGNVGAGEAVRIMTGAVLPAGADMRGDAGRAREVEGDVAIAAGAVTQARDRTVRFAGEDLKRRASRRSAPASCCAPPSSA